MKNVDIGSKTAMRVKALATANILALAVSPRSTKSTLINAIRRCFQSSSLRERNRKRRYRYFDSCLMVHSKYILNLVGATGFAPAWAVTLEQGVPLDSKSSASSHSATPRLVAILSARCVAGASSPASSPTQEQAARRLARFEASGAIVQAAAFSVLLSFRRAGILTGPKFLSRPEKQKPAWLHATWLCGNRAGSDFGRPCAL